MTDNRIMDTLSRIEHALARIEKASNRKPADFAATTDSRYQALRTRTQAALASLETVITQAGGRR